jgi:hypothetical protein
MSRRPGTAAHIVLPISPDAQVASTPLHGPLIIVAIKAEPDVARTFRILVDIEVSMMVARVLAVGPGCPHASTRVVNSFLVDADIDIVGPVRAFLESGVWTSCKWSCVGKREDRKGRCDGWEGDSKVHVEGCC